MSGELVASEEEPQMNVLELIELLEAFPWIDTANVRVEVDGMTEEAISVRAEKDPSGNWTVTISSSEEQ